MSEIITIEKHFVRLDTLNDDSIIVDVGACEGDIIRGLREHEQTKKCKIFAIECDRKNVVCIKKQGFSNVEICEKALVGQDMEGPVSFFRCRRGPNWGSIGPAGLAERWVQAEDRYNVKTLKINDIFDELGIDKIDYMKMDIEGSEKFILSTMSCEAAKKIKQMSIEVHWPNVQLEISMDWAEKWLKELGFEIKRAVHAEIFCER